MSDVWPYLAAILPTILVAVFFYFLVKSMLEGDRRERMAQRKFEAEQDARRAASADPNRPSSAAPGEAPGNGTTAHHRPPHDDLGDPTPGPHGN
jgi:hypothetical protein